MSSRKPGSRRRFRRASEALGIVLMIVTLFAVQPREVEAQLSAPCKAACGLVLGLSSYAVATGTVAAWGRLTGGLNTANQGKWVWASGFTLAAGAGIALSGNGERQERAVYGAGLGVLAGATVGLIVGSIRSGDSKSRRLAATLIGAAGV